MRILLAYGSRFGSTKGIAQSIAASLEPLGHRAELQAATSVSTLNGFDAVIVGAPIHYDKWMSEAADFIKAHERELAGMPHAFFFSCLALSRGDERSSSQAQAYADAISAQNSEAMILPVGQFAGTLNFGDFPLWQRLFVRTLFFFLRVEEGDHRNQNLIRAWSQQFSAAAIKFKQKENGQ